MRSARQHAQASGWVTFGVPVQACERLGGVPADRRRDASTTAQPSPSSTCSREPSRRRRPPGQRTSTVSARAPASTINAGDALARIPPTLPGQRTRRRRGAGTTRREGLAHAPRRSRATGRLIRQAAEDIVTFQQRRAQPPLRANSCERRFAGGAGVGRVLSSRHGDAHTYSDAEAGRASDNLLRCSVSLNASLFSQRLGEKSPASRPEGVFASQPPGGLTDFHCTSTVPLLPRTCAPTPVLAVRRPLAGPCFTRPHLVFSLGPLQSETRAGSSFPRSTCSRPLPASLVLLRVSLRPAVTTGFRRRLRGKRATRESRVDPLRPWPTVEGGSWSESSFQNR